MFKLFRKFYKRKETNSLEEIKEKFNHLNNELLHFLSQKENVTSEELKNVWLKNYLINAENDFKNEFNNKLKNIREKYNEESTNIILEMLSHLNYQQFRDDFIVKTLCKNEEIKGRLVGLNGRNKKCFERTCGVELIINENDEYITISSANHIKREIANRVLQRLIQIKNIEPNKIENYYEEEKNNFENDLFLIGKDVIEKQLNFKNINAKIYPYVGRLKYRYSFGQNVLEHSIEASLIAEQLANEIKVNPSIAKIATFFHDIGKSIDHETGKDHVEQGIIIAQKFNLPQEVLTSIESHHDAVQVSSVYDSITKLADRISACKPGARKNSKEDFFHRAKIYEEICMSFPEVKNCYVLKSGFVIKVIIKPNSIKDNEIELLAYKIKKAFEENPQTKKYVLSIELIKETTYKIKTEKINNIFE